MEGSAFPAPQIADPDQVSTALETATALWVRGDAREAVRWLRRAAEMAGEAGDDLRAVQLARAAADLTSELQIPPSAVAASAQPLPPPSSRSRLTPAPPQPLISPPRQSAPPPHSQSAPPQRPPPPSQQRPSGSHALSTKPEDDSGAASPRRSPQPPPLRPPSSMRSNELGDVITSAPPLPKEQPALRPIPGPEASRPRQALHVAVMASEADDSTLFVRLLAEGETAPPGSHEALLVAVEPGADLRAKPR